MTDEVKPATVECVIPATELGETCVRCGNRNPSSGTLEQRTSQGWEVVERFESSQWIAGPVTPGDYRQAHLPSGGVGPVAFFRLKRDSSNALAALSAEKGEAWHKYHDAEGEVHKLKEALDAATKDTAKIRDNLAKVEGLYETARDGRDKLQERVDAMGRDLTKLRQEIGAAAYKRILGDDK